MDERNLDFDTNSEVASLNFKALWNLLKASFVRIILFCVIAVIVMGTVSVIAFFATRESKDTISAVYQYNYSGIEDGKDPVGGTLDIYKIKSPQIINAAINALNSAFPNITEDKQVAVINNITLSGFVPENVLLQQQIIQEIATKEPAALKELLDIRYFPSRYTISLSGYKHIGLNRVEAIALVNEILSQYMENFRKLYGATSLIPDNAILSLSQSATDAKSFGHDYIEINDILEAQIATAISFISPLKSVNSLFRSPTTGRSFADIESRLDMVRFLNLASYERDILLNGLTENLSSVVNYLILQKTSTIRLKTEAENNALAMEAIIGKYEKSQIVIIGGGTNGTDLTYSASSAAYDALFAKYQQYEESANYYTRQIAAIEHRMSYYATVTDTNIILDPNNNNTIDNRQAAFERAQSVATQLTELINEANQTINDFYDLEYMRNAVSINLPATFSSGQSQTIMLLFILSACVVALTAVAAVITTHSIEKRKVARKRTHVQPPVQE